MTLIDADKTEIDDLIDSHFENKAYSSTFKVDESIIKVIQEYLTIRLDYFTETLKEMQIEDRSTENMIIELSELGAVQDHLEKDGN